MVKPERPSANPSDIPDFLAFLDELQSESDRATATLAATYLDAQLRRLLAEFLVDDRAAIEELLDRPYAPLGTFASRISAAYFLGLIGPKHRRDLLRIKSIRNAFAHGRHGVKFSTPGIQEECVALSEDRLMSASDLEQLLRKFSAGDAGSARYFFVLAAMELALGFEWHEMLAKHNRRTVARDLTSLVLDLNAFNR